MKKSTKCLAHGNSLFCVKNRVAGKQIWQGDSASWGRIRLEGAGARRDHRGSGGCSSGARTNDKGILIVLGDQNLG